MYRVSHVARELAANVAMGIPAVRAMRIRRGRTTGIPVANKARAIVAQFEFFMDSIGWDDLHGKTVVEIGPGDAIALAFLFLSAGAGRYVAVDRFLGDVTGPQALQIYDAVLEHAPPRLRASASVPGTQRSTAALLKSWLAQDRIRLANVAIDDESPALAAGGDYIVSFNVCEHLTDVRRALRNMTALLSPAGRMIHRVDYGPHDIWQRYGNPLAFLTVPATLWKMMSQHRGCPNRVRHQQLLRTVTSLGLVAVDRVGQCAPLACVHEVRPHLAEEFRHLSDGDLQVLDAEVVCGFGPQLELGRTFADPLADA